jgi:hypothetical protein
MHSTTRTFIFAEVHCSLWTDFFLCGQINLFKNFSVKI